MGTGILAVSTAAPLVRLAMDAAADRTLGFSLVIAATRLTLATIVLLPQSYGVYQQRPNRVALGYAIAAGLALAVHFATWITSLAFTSVAASTAIVTTNPIWIALLSWVWLREKPSGQRVIGIGIALAGGLLIGLDAGPPNPAGQMSLLGNALALLGAWMVSLYLLLGRQAQHHGLNLTAYILVAYSTAAIALLPLPWLFQANYHYPPTVYGYIALTALLPQLVGHTSLNWAIRWISPTLVSLVILFEPVLASALAFLLFAEIPPITVFLGAGVLLMGVAIAVLAQTAED